MDVLDKKEVPLKRLSFIEWLQLTFTDHDGIPSFKRQLVLLFFILLVFMIIIDSSPEVIEIIAWVIVGLSGVTGVEKFSKTRYEKFNSYDRDVYSNDRMRHTKKMQ